MKVAIIGEGAREHAIALMLLRSGRDPKIYNIATYRNPGLLRVAERSGGKVIAYRDLNPEIALHIVNEISPDLIIVGPEEYQFKGYVDLLKSHGFPVFGATRALAEIEKSKVYMRSLMERYRIPGRVRYNAFKDLDEALDHIERSGDVVLKPARQAGGKGVKVISDFQEYLKESKREARIEHAREIVANIMASYRDIDYKILIEERLEGVEYTIMTITDGSTVLPLPVIQDHPHAFEMDLGPETGGMGSIQGPGYLLPFITSAEYEESISIIRKTIDALQKDAGELYTGVLSAQMMLTSQYGPTVIEYYSRFGDPEISNLLPILETDILELFEYAVDRKLSKAKIEIKEDIATVVKAIAPKGYPGNRSIAIEHPIKVNEKEIDRLGCYTLYSGVYIDDSGNMLTTGSRALEVSCYGYSIEEASQKANLALEHVESLDGWRFFYRRDIGSKTLLSKRIEQAELARKVYRYRRENDLLYRSL